jgi:thymidine kinase
MRHPKIVVYVGSMFSGKTDMLIVEAANALLRTEKVVIFRPETDTRQDDPEIIVSHSKQVLEGKKATIVGPNDFDRIKGLSADCETVVFDEIQFFGPGSARVVQELYLQGKRIICGGLDYDWRGEPFETTMRVMAIPEAKIFKCRQGVCRVCRNTATRSQKVDAGGKPIPLSDESPRVETGDREMYSPLCLKHWLETTPQ